MEIASAASNLVGYIAAFGIIVALFAVVRLALGYSSRPAQAGAPSGVAPAASTPTPSAISALDAVAAAVAAAHLYLRSKARKESAAASSLLRAPRYFINYWTLSERLNPYFREDPFHRERVGRGW